jgi:hypothetical protein
MTKLIKVLVPIELTVRVDDNIPTETVIDGIIVNIHTNYGDVYDLETLEIKEIQ